MANTDHNYAKDPNAPNTPKYIGTQCAAVGCYKSTGRNKEVAFHSFPKEKKRCAEWINNIRREDLCGLQTDEMKHRKVCSDHFAISQFVNPLDRKSGLLPMAVPWLVDCPNPPKSQDTVRPPPRKRVALEIETTDSEILDSTDVLASVSNDNTVEKLKRKIGCYKSKLSRLKKKTPSISKQTLKREISKVLPKQAAQFVNEQIDNAKKKPRAIRWSNFMKSWALQVKGTGPKAYRTMRRIFKLPTARTLSNILQRVDIGPGWHEPVLYALKHQVQHMEERDRHVAITFDEITLKCSLNYNISKDEVEGYDEGGRPANHAGVFMIRSLTGKWKQPIGYFLSSGTMKHGVLKTKIMEAVEKVLDTGFTPMVLVMDQGSNNLAACRNLGITEEKPYFFVKSQKIHFLFDPPHLMKNIRNNLRKYGFYIGDKLAEWGDITEMFKIDSQRQHRMAPKLTQRHLSLTAFSTMSVPLATQVSHK
ncbi:uncharacterized protein LOC134469433 isoform X3 [Engraulis encrasicolus]|uniref:uncharacterized protein LOC134469433 isoform X3 n=2 Tax=Engraulis encrasicolus TaxID=184585 RepID=UPI002FCECB0B